jgi:aminoglycoside phosphotransferase family enzyme
LNARLAPGVYLGVLAMQWRDGAFSLIPDAQLPAPGETVDWLVLMRRLPAYRMLPHMMANHNVLPNDIDALVCLLSGFYRDAPVVPVAASDYVNRFMEKQASNRELLLRPMFKLLDAARAMDRLDLALPQAAELLSARASGHRLVDGHGDLRPDHVCLLQPPVVIDCLEFNPQLRHVDPFDEISFLDLECDMAGASWIGPRLIAGVAKALCDYPQSALMHFYAAHHALLRARLAVSHLLDPEPRTPEKWLPLAQRYVARALVAIDSFNATRQRDTIE